jgi:hypothetical protein
MIRITIKRFIILICVYIITTYSLTMSVLVDTITVTTDKFAELSQRDITYTAVTLRWFNQSTDSADFRIVNEQGVQVSDVVTVEGRSSGDKASGQGETRVTKIKQLSVQKFYLERMEHDEWIRQTSSTEGLDYVLTTMKSTSVSTSIGSHSAIVQWTDEYEGAQYTVKTPAGTFTNADMVTNDGIKSLTLTGMNPSTQFRVVLSVLEESDEESGAVTLWNKQFKTSEAATFQVDEIYASYANVSWSKDGLDSAEGLGSQEEDGVADFRVLAKVSSEEKWAVVVESTPETINSATIEGLEPGFEYDLKLERLQLDGSWVQQVVISMSTVISSMSIQSIGSRSIEVSWTPLYDGAVYELTYTSGDEGTKLFGDATLSETDAIIKDLTPNTAYTIELYVIEEGERVGVATLQLGSSVEAKTSRDYVMIGGISFALMGVAAVVAMKLRNKQ